MDIGSEHTEMLICFVWVKQKKTEDLKAQFRKYDLLAQIVLHMNYQQKIIFISFKIRDELTKNTGSHSTNKKKFHESYVRNRASLVYAFDYLCGWKGKFSLRKTDIISSPKFTLWFVYFTFFLLTEICFMSTLISYFLTFPPQKFHKIVTSEIVVIAR